MKLATWNVNSIRARLDLLVDWLERQQPDVVALQETKVVDSQFPTGRLADIGYSAFFTGEKSYNGVALLATEPIADIRVEFPIADNHDARLISGVTHGVRVYSAYFPNGRDPESAVFPVKLRWIDGLAEIVSAETGPVAILGDYNVAPEPRDVYDPIALDGKIHYHPDERAALQRLMAHGLVDAFRLRESGDKLYSWWDYRAGMFRQNLGLRIDHAWVSESLADRVTASLIDKAERAKQHASDHAPLMIELSL